MHYPIVVILPHIRVVDVVVVVVIVLPHHFLTVVCRPYPSFENVTAALLVPSR
jgi:hypothetical protein